MNLCTRCWCNNDSIISMIMNSATAYPTKMSSSTPTSSREDWKIKSSRISFSAMTKGLKEVTSRSQGEMVSIGSTTPEMNNNKLPMEMEANTPVSSDVNR